MTKKKDAEVNPAINDSDRPTLATPGKILGDDVLSHNWQPGSPAVDLRYAGVGEAATNVVQAHEAAEETKKKKKEKVKKKPLTEEEYKRRTELDVSHPDFINESLDHHEVE